MEGFSPAFNSTNRGIFRKFIRNVRTGASGRGIRDDCNVKGGRRGNEVGEGRGDVTTREFRGLSSSSRVNCILRALRASLYSPSTRDAAISEHNATCFEKEREREETRR